MIIERQSSEKDDKPADYLGMNEDKKRKVTVKNASPRQSEAPKTEENKQKAFVPAVLPSSQGLYSFLIFFMMLQELSNKPIQVIFAGVICGLPCFFSAIGQAKTAAACIKSINNKQMNLGAAVIVSGMPELYALFGMSGAFLLLLQ